MQDFDAYMNPVDAPVAADDLHGDVQRRAGGEGRHLQDPAKLPPKDVEDPEAPTTCKLESYEATPTYEM